MAAILRIDLPAILHEAGLLGRVIDTFAVSQLRGELEVCASRPRLYHLRDQDGRREVDIVAELGGERVLGFEVKAGVVFHTGPHAFSLGERITALPISAIWATP